MASGSALGEHQAYAIRTLGEFCVLQGDRRLPLGQARERALLIYLAFGIGKSFHRETLVDLLWGAGGSRERRHGLSQLLYSLKQRFPLLELTRTRDSVLLQAGITSIDASDLLASVDAGHLEVACDLFTGQFLDGFYIDGVGRFDDWRESISRTVNGAAARALRARLGEADASGRWWLVERTSNQLLELDPYDEHVHALRIRSIAADGDGARAARELDRAVDLLRRDLGQPPGPELQELIARIGDSSAGNQSDVPDEPQIKQFVGRTREFQELREAWTSVVKGRGVAAAICGEAGIGKSRLCTQLLRVAAIEGGRIFNGRCSESSVQVPYGGICQALGGVRESEIRLSPPHWRTALEVLLPELATKLSDSVDEVEQQTGGGRRHLFEAVVQLIRAIARRTPVAIFIDDLQWADRSTTELLHYLAGALSDDQVLILVAVRPEELRPAALARLISGFRKLTLKPLSPDEASELLTLVDLDEFSEIPAAIGRRILAQGAGRPFLIIELMRYFASHETWSEPRASQTTVEQVPAPIEALLARRLRSLSTLASHTVDVLAVLGGEATMTLLERTAHTPARQLVIALEELQYRQIIEEAGSAYAFSHDLMREAVERRLSTARRRWLNKSAASARQRLPRTQPGAIALHMCAAGDSQSAYTYALQAASHSQRLFAHSEATFFLRLAATTAPDLDTRFVALDRLCRHLYSLADLPGVRDVLAELRPWYAANGDRHGMFMAAVSELDSALYDGKSPAIELRRRAGELSDLIDISLDTAESPAVPLILQAAQFAWDSGHSEFIATFADGIHRAASRGPPNLNGIRRISAASMAYGLYISAAGGYKRARMALRSAKTIADPASELAAQLACGATGTLSGYYLQAQRHFARAWRLSADDALQHLRRQVIINRAVLLMERGRLVGARRLLESAVGCATIHDRLFLFGNLAFVGLEQHDWSSIKRYAGELEETNRVLQAWWATVAVRMLRGFVALGEGDSGRARSIGGELEHMINRGPGIAAGVLDSSYTNILLARVGLLGSDAGTTAVRLEYAADVCRSTNVGAAVRLDLERARILRRAEPDVASEVARSVWEWAMQSGARLAGRRAKNMLRDLGAS